MKIFRKSTLALILMASGPLWISLTVEGASASPLTERFNLRHEVTQDSWEWRLPGDLKISVRACQDPGTSDPTAYAVFDFETPSTAKVEAEFGLTPKLGQVVAEGETARKEHEIRLDGLRPRATEYYVRFRTFDASSAWSSPVLSFQTLLRYTYGYSFSTNDPELHWQEGVPRIITTNLCPQAAEVSRRIRDVDAKAYLQHIIQTIIQPQMTQLEKVKAIMTFVGTAVHHNPLYVYDGPYSGLLRQDPNTGFLEPGGDQEAVMVLELHYCQCGTVQPVAAALFRLIDVGGGAWPAPNGHHSSGRVMINGQWCFADEDAYKKGAFPLMLDGSLPPLDWLLQGDHVYLLDTKRAWSDWGSNGDWMLTKDGFLITGNTGGGHDSSEDAYASAWFGARTEFPPSLPRPLPVTHFERGEVLLEWGGSYDRDNDFRDYIVEVGTGPELSDIGRFHTTRAFYEVKLPHEGRYYWRVRATDHHASGTPYAGKIYYENSKESSFDTARLPQGLGDSPNTKSLHPPEDVLFSLDVADGSLGGLEPRGAIPDEATLGTGAYAGTDLFNVEWGKDGRVLELMDPSNRWASPRRVVRRTWYKAVTARITPEDSWELSCAIRTGRSFIAGNSSFPLLYVTDPTSAERAIGITLDPVFGTVSGATRDSVGWSNLDAFDPQNRWHTYTVRFSASEKARSSAAPQKNVISYFVDGKQLGANATIPEGVTPGTVWISSNPVADVTAWIGKVEIDRVRR